MTVAERLKPESLYRRFLDYRRVAWASGSCRSPAGPGPAPRCSASGWPTGGVTCLLVDRNLGSGGVPVDFFGRTATMPGGAALLAAQTGAALLPDRLPVHRARLAAGRSPRRSRSTGPGGSRTGCRAPCSRSPTRSPPRSPRSPRTGTCSAGSGPTWRRRPIRRPAEPRLMRIGLVCPYQWDVPGGVQYHVRDLARDAARPGPPRRGAHARRARGVPARRVDHLRRAHRAGPVQRLDGQHPVRPGVGGPGAAVAARGRTSTSSTCTSRRRRRCPCWSA